MNANYIAYLKASKKSEGTIARYSAYVDDALKCIGKADTDITYMDLLSYQSSISSKSANSVCVRLSAIKSYFAFLKKVGEISVDPSSGLEKPKVNPKEKPYMTSDDVRAMINATKKTRDKAVVAFIASTGVRVSELVNITLDEYSKAIQGNREIVILGKGAKERSIYINEQTQNLVDAYLATRRPDDCAWLFASTQHGQIHPNNLCLTIKGIARKAGLPYWQDISNHSLRAASATIMSDNGVPVGVISKALGHSSLQVTSRYVKAGQRAINNAMAGMVF